MHISGKRIINIERYISHFAPDSRIRIGVVDNENWHKKLIELGFSKSLQVGETILPAICGPVTRFNANGTFIARKDLPKEDRYIRTIEWTWEQWCGKGETETMNDYRDIYRMVYPRDYIPAPSLELSICKNDEEKKLIVTQEFSISQAEELKLAINIFLEIFGECNLLDRFLRIPIEPIKLNWEILPPGDYPWERFKQILKPIIEREPKGNQSFIWKRLETVEQYKPDFKATGSGGFHGYLIYGFSSKKLFILESARSGNATYVLGPNWVELSKLSKKEILSENLHFKRIIHKSDWEHQFAVLMSQRKAA